MKCPDCGYEIDEVNESQPVCPRCVTNPNDPNSCPVYDDSSLPLEELDARLALEKSLWRRRQEEERKLYEEPDSKLIN